MKIVELGIRSLGLEPFIVNKSIELSERTLLDFVDILKANLGYYLQKKHINESFVANGKSIDKVIFLLAKLGLRKMDVKTGSKHF